MKIYTKTGDLGQTSLANGQRVDKYDPRLEAYGTADELNSFVGLLRCQCGGQMGEQIEWIQNKLFNLGAALAQASGEWITEEDVALLEQWIDQIQNELPVLHDFILPGGSQTISLCHVCRTITRRLERQMVVLKNQKMAQCETDNLCCFVNRLSDFWFVLARKCAKIEGIAPILWKK